MLDDSWRDLSCASHPVTVSILFPTAPRSLLFRFFRNQQSWQLKKIRKQIAPAATFTTSHIQFREEPRMADPRYPLGKFHYQGAPSEPQRAKFIAEIERTPAAMRSAVEGLSAQQLDTPYRAGGWTVRQVVHHLPDSHMNAYIRFKLALTEDEPIIKPYAEDRWAKLEDSQATPIEVSLALLENLHERWVTLLRSLSEQDWKRNFKHPELGLMPLEKNLAIYAWHGRHHTAHVTELRKTMNW
jgi:DinB superfamily